MAKPFIDFSVIGEKKLRRKLQQMEPRVVKRVIKQGMVQVLKPVEVEAKRRVPVKSGRLKRSIKTVQYSGRHHIGAAVKTGTRKQLKISASSKGYYPAILEYGTQDRRAVPFLRSALASKKKQALKMVSAKIREAIESQAK